MTESEPIAPPLRLLTRAPSADTAGEPLRLANDTDALSVSLQGVAVIELDFPVFTDGRAFSQAVQLRKRRGFVGEIRATGDVLVDQLQQMQRVGFSSAVLRADQNLVHAWAQLSHFQNFYQGDAQRQRPRFAMAQA